jgi:hypothetical protein
MVAKIPFSVNTAGDGHYRQGAPFLAITNSYSLYDTFPQFCTTPQLKEIDFSNSGVLLAIPEVFAF